MDLKLNFNRHVTWFKAEGGLRFVRDYTLNLRSYSIHIKLQIYLHSLVVEKCFAEKNFEMDQLIDNFSYLKLALTIPLRY